MAKVRGNIGPASQEVVIDASEGFAIYDAFSAEAKKLYDSTPEPIDPREFRDVLLIYGQERGLRLIKEALKKKYPRWRPIE